MTDAISVTGLVKTFGRTRAVDGLDLVVRTGEVHGFLGPNGSQHVRVHHDHPLWTQCRSR
jgi:ABC-type branched-subunit amino acid transport system ATPase component